MKKFKKLFLVMTIIGAISLNGGCAKETDGYTKVAMGYYQNVVDILGDCETELNNLYVMHWEGADEEFVECIPGYYYIYEIHVTYTGEPRTTMTVIIGDDNTHVYSESESTGTLGDYLDEVTYYTVLLGYNDYQDNDQYITDTKKSTSEYGIINVDKDYVEQNYEKFDVNELSDLRDYMFE